VLFIDSGGYYHGIVVESTDAGDCESVNGFLADCSFYSPCRCEISAVIEMCQDLRKLINRDDKRSQ